MPRSIKLGEVVVRITAQSQFKDEFGFAKMNHVQAAITNNHAFEVYGLYSFDSFPDMGVWFMPNEVRIYWPKEGN